MIDKILHPFHHSPADKEKRAEMYNEGKHIDIVPGGYIPGEAHWREPKPLTSDFDVHNLNLNI